MLVNIFAINNDPMMIVIILEMWGTHGVLVELNPFSVKMILSSSIFVFDNSFTFPLILRYVIDNMSF